MRVKIKNLGRKKEIKHVGLKRGKMYFRKVPQKA